MISYPVQPGSRFVVYDTETGDVTRLKKWPQIDGMPPVGVPANLRFLEIKNAPRPAFDAATQNLELTWVIDLPNEEYRREFAVYDLQGAELEAAQRQARFNGDRQSAAGVLQAMKDGTGTNAQRIRRVEQVLARVARHAFQID